MKAPFLPPDNRPALLESALGRFVRDDGVLARTVATDRLRPTPGWRGLTDAELVLLVELGFATASAAEPDGRRRASLTDEGFRRCIDLAQRGRGLRRHG